MKYSLFLVLIIFFVSCSKENEIPQQKLQKAPQQEDSDNPADTNLTPEEKFSTAVLFDFLGGSDDEDLADFLETEIYKMGSNYTGASVVEISPAVWFLMLEKNGSTKSYLIEKFVDFKTNDYYFQLKETTLTITDIVTRGKTKLPGGD